VRTSALLAALVAATSVAARVGPTTLAAHQIAYQMLIFLALAMDALALSVQAIVGTQLGAADVDGAVAASRRMIGWALVLGCAFGALLMAGIDLVPRAFTDDEAVLRAAHDAWPLFAVMQPAAAVIFALDGILIGAGDTRYLAAAMVAALAAFVPAALVANDLRALWGALLVLMAVRLATTGARFIGRRWAVVGAPVAAP